MKNLFGTARAFVLAFTFLMTAACGTMPGIFNGEGSDPMSMLVIYRTDNKPLTYQQYLAVQEVAQEMHITLVAQLSGPLEAGASGGVAYGAAGGAGGATQGLFYTGAMTGAAAGYTAAVYGLGGVVNGVVTHSYANDYALAQMVEETLRDRERYDQQAVFARIHAVAALVRSRNNRNSPAPALREQMPDFSGPATEK